jgi:ribosomal protein L11 methylase PrmA
MRGTSPPLRWSDRLRQLTYLPPTTSPFATQGSVNREPLTASFRDPSGFVFCLDGVLYRQVNYCYRTHYDQLMDSGLYEALVSRAWMVAHEDVSVDQESERDAYRTLRLGRVPFISYPYEWCFSQLKDAALLTLNIQMLSLSHGMTLKDASAYNIQFTGHRPVFIDTLSFESYEDGVPWVAYRQFCQHFLAPLALMSRIDVRLGRLLRTCLDGVPLDLASAMLPLATRFRPALLLHIHAHARSQKRHESDGREPVRVRIPRLPKPGLIALLDSLRRAVEGCEPPRRGTEWSDYYQNTSYTQEAMAAKESAVQRMVETYAERADTIHDIGANTGRFSRLLTAPGRCVVSHDIDEIAVERNYLQNKALGIAGVLPLVLDLANPSPSIGWDLSERASTLERLSRGTVVALALIHHLAIANNVPLPRIARFFARCARTLIIEFVPREDSQVQRLLATREDIFPRYTQDEFEAVFSVLFETLERQPLPGTVRTVYAMRLRE